MSKYNIDKKYLCFCQFLKSLSDDELEKLKSHLMTFKAIDYRYSNAIILEMHWRKANFD